MVSKMEGLTEQERRNIIVEFYERNVKCGKSYTVKHFQEQGVSRRTCYSVLATYEERGSTKRATGSGRPAVKMPKAARTRLLKAASDKKGVTSRKLARKFNIDRSYVSKLLAKGQVKWHRRERAPAATPEQEQKQRARCRKLSRERLPAKSDISIIMDDESFFPFKHDEMPGNAGYYTSDKENTPPEVRYRRKKKFPPKLLVWMAISDRGYSELFFVPNKGSINGEVYRTECIERRLLPFITKHHSDGNYLFWPDLASAHYANLTTTLLKDKNVNFVDKQSNPPNVPQLRPIEDVWLWLQQKVYEGGWEAETEAQLRRRIKRCVKEVDWVRVQKALKAVKTNLRKAADQGALAVLH